MKCKHLKLDLVAGMGEYCSVLKCMTRMKSKCPAYHGYDIKPRKKKSMVRVKAHFYKDASGAIIAFNSKANREFKPCIILINRKDLEDQKH